jgi:site-specific DNA recombinase
LKNPKYTGFQVFNRRASRSRHGKVNDPVKWVWSTEPAHEPLIPKWMYDELNARRATKRGSRDGNAANAHPETRRTYVLRGMVFCACGRRMFGTHRQTRAYYLCWPRNNNRGRPDKYTGHPKAVYVREDAILDAVARFFADRVFGTERRAILAADLAGVDDRATRERQTGRERLQRTLADIARRQNSIMRQAQDGDPDDPFTTALRGSYNDLDAEKTATLAAIAGLDAADEAEPGRPGIEDTALLDALPYLALNLADAPEALLRKLFEISQLAVRSHDEGDRLTITIRLPADQLPDIAHAAERITELMSSTQETPAQTAGAACVDAVRAPGGSRTHTGRVLSPLPLPVGLRGRIVGGITVRGGWTCSRLRSWAAIVAGWGVAGRREVAGDSAS